MRIFKIIFFLFLAHTLSAQIGLEIPQDTVLYQIKFRIISDHKNQFMVTYDTSEIPDRIEKFEMRFKDADLIITSNLEKLKKKKIFNYSTKLEVAIANKQPLNIRTQNLDNTQWGLKKKRVGNNIIWKNVTEGKIFPYSEYTLTYSVIKNKRYGFNCDNPPTFKFKQKWPYFATATVGTGLIIASRIIRKNALTKRDSAAYYKTFYEDSWRIGKSINELNGALNKNNSAIRDAISKEKWQSGLIIAGISAIVSSATGYYLHWRFYKKNKELFQENCEEKNAFLDIHPVINLGDGNANQHLGLSLTYTF